MKIEKASQKKIDRKAWLEVPVANDTTLLWWETLMLFAPTIEKALKKKWTKLSTPSTHPDVDSHLWYWFLNISQLLPNIA